jgi:hypothetical protein
VNAAATTEIQSVALPISIESFAAVATAPADTSWGCGFARLCPRKPAIDLANALFEACFWPPAESGQPT